MDLSTLEMGILEWLFYQDEPASSDIINAAMGEFAEKVDVVQALESLTTRELVVSVSGGFKASENGVNMISTLDNLIPEID